MGKEPDAETRLERQRQETLGRTRARWPRAHAEREGVRSEGKGYAKREEVRREGVRKA